MPGVSDAQALDQLWLALANVIGLVSGNGHGSGRYHYPWFRGVRTFRGKATVELLVGEPSEPQLLRETFSVSLDALRSRELGSVEMDIYRAYQELHERWKLLPKKPAFATAPTSVDDDEDDEE